MDENQVFDYKFLKTATPEQVVNYCDKRVEELTKIVANKPPPPTDEVTANEHLSWRHRMLIYYGRCMESLMAAQAWGHITPAQYMLLRNKLAAVVNWKMADVLMGAPHG